MKKNVEDVKERIIKAAMKVFANYGYFRASTNLIAREAGVSKGLIFWYFRTKDELILEIATRSLPVDVLDKCLSSNLKGIELLECVGRKYMEKYSDPMMRNLMLQTMAVRTIYPQIEVRLREICSNYIKKLAEAAFNIVTEETRTRARTFFGSLMCYILSPPTDISSEAYLKHLIKILTY